MCCVKALFQQFKDSEIPICEMSTLTGEGVMEARTEVWTPFDFSLSTQVPAEYVNRYRHTLKLLRWFEYYNFGIS